jgi:hypothetical protein
MALLSPASNEWARIANSTIPKFLKGMENEIARKRATFALIKKRGNIKYNCSGDGIRWAVRYRRNTMLVNDGEQPLETPRVNRLQNASLDFIGYAIAESYTKREKVKNRSAEAIANAVSESMEHAKEDLEDQFTEEFYVNSAGTGNSARASGINSLFPATQTITVTSGAARSANAADPCFYPNATYAQLSTVLGNYNGTWETSTDIYGTWPYGRGKPEYDFWSPVIVNYESTAFDGSSSTFDANCVLATRFGIEAINGRNMGSGSQVDLVTYDRGLFRVYKNKLDSKERIAITSDNELRALGFKDTIEQDGVSVTSGEYGMPAKLGYGMTMSNVQLWSWQSQLFNLDENAPEWDLHTRSWKFVIDFLGQWRFRSPRAFCLFRPLSGVTI